MKKKHLQLWGEIVETFGLAVIKTARLYLMVERELNVCLNDSLAHHCLGKFHTAFLRLTVLLGIYCSIISTTVIKLSLMAQHLQRW